MEFLTGLVAGTIATLIVIINTVPGTQEKYAQIALAKEFCVISKVGQMNLGKCYDVTEKKVEIK